MQLASAILRFTFRVVIVGGMAGCQAVSMAPPSSTHSRVDIRQLNYYKTANPVVDCRAAIKAGDRQFLAISGMADIVPGIPDFKSKWSAKYSYRVIEGTSEFADSLEHIRLQESAARYAAAYNKSLLRYLESNEATKRRSDTGPQ